MIGIKDKKFGSEHAFGAREIAITDDNGNAIVIWLDLTDFSNIANAIVLVNGEEVYKKDGFHNKEA